MMTNRIIFIANKMRDVDQANIESSEGTSSIERHQPNKTGSKPTNQPATCVANHH